MIKSQPTVSEFKFEVEITPHFEGQAVQITGRASFGKGGTYTITALKDNTAHKWAINKVIKPTEDTPPESILVESSEWGTFSAALAELASIAENTHISCAFEVAAMANLVSAEVMRFETDFPFALKAMSNQ